MARDRSDRGVGDAGGGDHAPDHQHQVRLHLRHRHLDARSRRHHPTRPRQTESDRLPSRRQAGVGGVRQESRPWRRRRRGPQARQARQDRRQSLQPRLQPGRPVSLRARLVERRQPGRGDRLRPAGREDRVARGGLDVAGSRDLLARWPVALRVGRDGRRRDDHRHDGAHRGGTRGPRRRRRHGPGPDRRRQDPVCRRR